MAFLSACKDLVRRPSGILQVRVEVYYTVHQQPLRRRAQISGEV
jgi:hypothetical protein